MANGKAGRPRKPTAIKKLEGNRGKRPLNNREPEPIPGSPEPPNWLSSTAREEWERVVPMLLELGLLTKLDMTSLAAYCDTWSEVVNLRKLIQKKGRIIKLKTKEGGIYYQQRPEITMLNKSYTQLRAFIDMFGLSPSARSRMIGPKKQSGEEDDPLEKMFRDIEKGVL